MANPHSPSSLSISQLSGSQTINGKIGDDMEKQDHYPTSGSSDASVITEKRGMQQGHRSLLGGNTGFFSGLFKVKHMRLSLSLVLTLLNQSTSAASRQKQELTRALWKSARSSLSISSDDLSTDDVIIAVMGPTGAGKSSFIQIATGTSTGVGHKLESCTTEISAIRVSFPEKSDSDVVFVDTPGFDDTNKSDSEILDMIAQWLKRTYERNIRLSGILYLHRISDNRMAGTPLKNLRMFQKLCGTNALQNIILTTTMWGEVQDEEGHLRENELRAKYWKRMIERGSTTKRFYNTTDSAWSIVEPLLLEANDRCTVRLQHEMVELKKQLPETKAGKELFGTLDKLVHLQRETLRKIREEAGRSENDEVLCQLKSEYDELQKKLETTVTEMETLRLPLRKRLIHMLLLPLGLTEVVRK